jgi:hypothetical protein
MPELKLTTDLLEEMRARPVPGEDDLTCAIVPTRLVRVELEAFSTRRTDSSKAAVLAKLVRAHLTVRAHNRGVRLKPGEPR